MCRRRNAASVPEDADPADQRDTRKVIEGGGVDQDREKLPDRHDERRGEGAKRGDRVEEYDQADCAGGREYADVPEQPRRREEEFEVGPKRAGSGRSDRCGDGDEGGKDVRVDHLVEDGRFRTEGVGRGRVLAEDGFLRGGDESVEEEVSEKVGGADEAVPGVCACRGRSGVAVRRRRGGEEVRRAAVASRQYLLNDSDMVRGDPPCENDASSHPFPRQIALAVDTRANNENRDHLGRLGETLRRVADVLCRSIEVSGGTVVGTEPDAREELGTGKSCLQSSPARHSRICVKFTSASHPLKEVRRSDDARVVRTRRSQSLREAAMFRLLPRLPQQDPQPNSDGEEAVEDDEEGGRGEMLVVRACAAGGALAMQRSLSLAG